MNIADFDIREYLDAIHVPYWEAGMNVSKGWIGLQCTHCDDHHNHMGVHTYYKNFSCWKCQAKGSLLDLITDLEGIAYHAALARIEEFQSDIPQEPEERERMVDDGQSILPLAYSNTLTKTQRRWVRGRRHNPEEIQTQWGIMAGPPTGRWAHRIICPFTYQGQVMTWVGIDTTGTKSTTYKAAAVEESFMPTSELLYGLDHVKPGGMVLVVEGILDAWRIGRGTVAMMGIGVGDRKVNALAALDVRQYFIMFDGEDLAIHNAHALGKTLRHMTGKPVEIIELEEGDPDDFNDDTAADVRNLIGLG